MWNLPNIRLNLTKIKLYELKKDFVPIMTMSMD